MVLDLAQKNDYHVATEGASLRVTFGAAAAAAGNVEPAPVTVAQSAPVPAPVQSAPAPAALISKTVEA